MTESVSQVASASQVAAQTTYNFNLNLTGQLALAAQETENVQETIDETSQDTTDGTTQTEEAVASASQVAAQTTYNFNLNVTGQLTLATQETENVQETIDENTQTSESG